MRLLVHGGKVTPTALTAKELLVQYAGSYTTARTYGRTCVFRLEQHLTRLVDSARSLGCPEIFLEEIPTQARSSMRLGAAQIASESRFTVLCTWTDSLNLWCLAEPLPPPPSPPISLVLRNEPRQDADVKNSKYVVERQKFEAIKGNCHDTLLSDGDEVLEGTFCNFFAIYPGYILRTAPVGKVLSGTVRAVVLECCERAGFNVDERPPLTKDMHLWEAAMVSSTSQLLVPVDEILIPSSITTPVDPDTDNISERWRSSHCDMEAQLCNLVVHAIAKESTPP